jgi:hypothetical protein
VVEGSCVGNRGAYWTMVGPLVNYNYLSNAILSANGLSLNNPADVAMLISPIGSRDRRRSFETHKLRRIIWRRAVGRSRNSRTRDFCLSDARCTFG